jgi:hypothetical protein
VDEVLGLPAFSDNYIWLLRQGARAPGRQGARAPRRHGDTATRRHGDTVAVVDPGQAEQVLQLLRAQRDRRGGALSRQSARWRRGGVRRLARAGCVHGVLPEMGGHAGTGR